MPNPSVVLATAGYDHTVRFWEATRGICYRTLQYADSQVNKLEITPDKRYLAAAGNPHIRLFEVNTANPTPVASYDGHTGNVTAVGFEKEGRWMYSGSDDGTVKIWDIRAAGHQREYESRGAVTCAALHPNGVELYVPWAFPNPTTVYEPSLSTRPSLKGSALHTAHMHCFISQLVTVQTDYPPCCPYIVQHGAIHSKMEETDPFSFPLAE